MGIFNKKVMRQAKEMQKRIAAAQEELAQQRTETSSGGGMVKAVILGASHLESLEINPEAVDSDDVEMLSELIIAAVNEGLEQAQRKAQEHMGFLGGL